MSAKFGHHPWSVEELVSGIDKGTIRLPDIQRPFVWPNAKVRDLIDSMYRGYPVGELMFWANNDGDHTTAIGSDTKTQDPSMQVVDGQQRLTSLYAVLKGLPVWREDYSREAIKLAFNPLTGRFEVPTAIIKRQADWIADIVGVFKDPIEARHIYLDSLRDDPRHTVDSSLERDVEVAIQRLAKLREYSFQVVQIKEEVTRETVAEIFVRINSEGVNLSSADFILTWMSVFWEQGRTELENWARNSRFTPAEVVSILDEKTTWTPHNPYMSFEPGQILRVAVAVGLRRAKLQDAYNVLRGRDPRTRIIDPARREIELARLKTGQAHATRPLHWDEFLKVLERAGFRSKDMITSENTVLYAYALWIIGRIDFKVPVDELREVMACWFFMSQITGRYTSSPETRMQEDLNRLDGLSAVAAEFVKILNGQIDAAVPDDWWRVTLPNNLDTSSAGAPAYVAYVAALNILDADVLLATSKVKDWINPNRRTLKGIEKHHLFPRDYLKTKLGLKDNRKINQVANFALVEWSDNITISNQPPNVYWPHQVATKNIEAGRRVRQEEWHALPDEWITLPYEEFLDQRRRLMAKVIHEGYKRLTDPNYEPDLTRPEDLATPISPLELPTFENLVISGVLPPGSLLTPVDPERSNTIAEVTEDGFIKVGEHLCETVDRAAREDHAEAGSGWDYWQAHLDGEDEPVTLAELRERALHSFRPEHSAALDWRNEHTNPDTRFFGVESEAVRIGDSAPAPNFKLVAEPNDWEKHVKAAAAAGAITERSKLYWDFFEQFRVQLVTQHPDWTRRKTATHESLYTLPTGISGAVFETGFTGGSLVAQVLFKDTDPTVNLARFNALHTKKGQFEQALGEEAVWDEMTGRKATRVYVASPFGDVEDVDQWPTMIDWLLDQHARFRQAIQAVGGLGSLA